VIYEVALAVRVKYFVFKYFSQFTYASHINAHVSLTKTDVSKAWKGKRNCDEI